MADQIQSEYNDERMRRLLKPLDEDAAPVDAKRLAQLRETTLREVSLRELAGTASTGSAILDSTITTTQIAAEDDASRVTVRQSDSPWKGRNMLVMATRAVIAATALVVGGFAWFFTGIDAEADLTLARVLDQARRAKTLQLKVVRDGEEADVWMRADGRLRWQMSPTSYRIADGTSLWEIDEAANIARRSDDTMLAAAATNHDLLALLGVGEDGAAKLRKAKPVATVRHGGTPCLVYRVTTPVDGRKLMFEVFVDKQTSELRTIVAWPAGQAKREGPPVAELHLVAKDVEVDENRFTWSKSLSEDGRIGKITDRQGIVLLRPKLHSRWTPICRQLRLRPGDQLRTDVRGANAVAARLTSGATITVGPGTLAQLVSPNVIRLHYGELQVVGGKKAELTIRGPMNKVTRPARDAATLYRIGRQRQVAVVPNKPVWLLGFEGASTNESIGSLITKVDGRDVPLTIGYHKVKVEIRDQIARTTIEESFVNRTDQRLEGIFHFPLPQDASISGFGMWIGGELVEADVVEKQRAREIYETILRERRDPGLLEWTGGNIFKARVFPIEAHSEKRIKIVYTQVLPLRANQYRYSYALRSEMLQKTPLRELSIDVLVHSALPLKNIDSPTHPVRVERTERSATVQFSAQEYSPKRDFELVCDVDQRTSDVVTIPHRRGDDGYFMIQLMPPSAQGNWQREVLPDGEPLELLLLCDTSGSMDKANRKTQADFIGAMLASLGPDDRFNIAVFDADCKWLFKNTVAPSGANVDQARDWLDDRSSLGWTDLDAAFASIQKRVGKKSQVVYIGDGVVSARGDNAQDFAARVRRLYAKKSRGTFHAVSTGSSFESVVLKAIASLGQGSVRSIGSGQTPMSIALELLNEMAQPGLRDLNVQFRGVEVAAVYPEQLPNLAAGTQQILIGRYLPTGADQSGEIVVTGTRDGEAVRYSAKIPLKDAEQGNSFVPRLWARAHLEHLLQQGNSQFIQDEIISLSEQFHIMTPYTSLLILETDEDRERFGVKRRFQMRDGERFFADGRDAANYELMQQVVREAGNWRLGLRYRILRQLARLGRDPQAVQQIRQAVDLAKKEMNFDTSSPMSSTRSSGFDVALSGEVGSPAGSAGWGFGRQQGGEEEWMLDVSGGMLGGRRGIVDFDKLGEVTKMPMGESESTLGDAESLRASLGRSLEEFSEEDFKDNITSIAGSSLGSEFNKRLDGYSWDGRRGEALAMEQRSKSSKPFSLLGVFEPRSKSKRERAGRLAWSESKRLGDRFYNYNRPNYVAWINTLFPNLPAPPARAVAKPEKKKSDWPKDAIRLSRSLLRNEWLGKLQGGLEIRRTRDSNDPQWNRPTSHSRSLDLYSKDAWLTWTVSGGSGKTIHWCDPKERGAISEVFSLGRVRKSTPQDRRKSFDAGPFAFGNPMHDSYGQFTAKVVGGAGVKQLVLTNKTTPSDQRRFTIDTDRHVVVKSETLDDGKVTWVNAFSDFVEIQGAWWPRRNETVNAEGQVTSTSSTTFTQLADKPFAKRITEELAVREQIQFLRHPVRTFEEAETAEADGSADFDDRLALIVRSSQIQKWDEVLKQLAALEELDGGAAGKRWMRIEILKSARRNNEAQQLVLAEAERLAEPQPADLARANHLIGSAWSVADANEVLELVARLKPVFDRQPAFSGAKWIWRQNRIRGLRSLSRIQEMLALEKTLAQQQPWNVGVQTQYARDLADAGDHKGAYDWLKAVIRRIQKLPSYQRDQVWRTWADLLQQEGEGAAQIEVVKQWIEGKPESEQPYSRYLASLVFDDRMDEVREVALRWLKAGRVEGRLSAADRSRTAAAISFAMGNAWNMYHGIVTPQWHEPLQKTALYFMNHEHHFDLTSRIMNGQQFSNTDAADVVRVRMFEQLIKNAATMKPSTLRAYAGWVRGGKPSRDAGEWTPIAETVRERWDRLEHTDKPDDEKHAVGDALSDIYANSFRQSDYLPFLRERIAQADKVRRDTYVKSLFDVLMSQPWTEQLEVELFGLLPQMSRNDPPLQLVTQVGAAHRLVDRMLAARVQVDEKELQDTGHPEKLTRQKLAKKRAGFLEAARKGLASRLTEVSKRHDGLLGQWLRMDRMYLDVRLKRNFDSVARECVVILGEKPSASNDDHDDEGDGVNADDDATAEELAARSSKAVVQAALRQRALVTYANLALRKSAKPELRQWLMAYVDAGIGNGGDAAATWKHMKYNLLVALDEPRQLEQVVRSWIRDDEYVTTWRRLLARLAAERGEIDEAISLFETIERDSQLTPSDYRALANWYLVRDRKEEFLRSKVEALKVVREYQLQNFISQHRSRWMDTNKPLPGELDEQVLFAFQALFEKSNNPGNYLYELREFYKACRDFRLLRMLPDSVVGRTPQQVYGFLRRLRTTALVEIRKEATADEILARIEQLRQRELTTIDLRALDLLEALIERQSAEVLNQPGPHIQAAVEALKRAFDREWADGEVRQMAQFLDSLGFMKQAELAAEQFRQLELLHQREVPGTDDRLFTGWFLANAMFNSYGKRDEGLRRMEIVIREFEATHSEGWPANANVPFDGYVRMLEGVKRHERAESFVKKHLEHPLNKGQRNWLMERLISVYSSALEADTRVSLGDRNELYQNLIPFVVKHAEKGDDNHRYRVLERLRSVFRTAKRKGFPTFRKDMRQFAFVTLPRFLKRQRNNYRTMVDQTAHLLNELLGPRIGLEFLVERIEHYPQRFMLTYENPWNQFGYRLGDWRRKVGDLGDLDPRLLAIVLTELRRDLVTRNRHGRYLYEKNSYFWAEKEADFAKVAEDVLAKHRGSNRGVRYVADYLWSGLRHRERAIEIMFVAQRDGIIDDNGRATLVDWLHHPEVKRYAESIAILEGLIQRSPVNMHFRCELITAYHRTSRSEQRATLMKETVELFRQGGRWNESNLSQLARCVHENSLDAQTIQLVGELIPMHQRSHPTRGIGQGTLPNYYMWLADAHSHLHHTKEAVDAAAAAIVSWGPRYDQRHATIQKLDLVIRSASDVDNYVALIDKTAESDGRDSAIIRRSIGRAYASKGQHEKAIAQLRIAIDLQPGDVDTHKLLMRSYDELGDKAGAVRQLLELIDVDRHTLSYYLDLEQRLRGDKEQAERAATEIVEAAPLEAEHHEALAKLREAKQDYSAAVLHWTQVAELRSLEPNGLIHLAKAQLLAKQREAARRTIDRLRKTDWPSRFESTVRNSLNELDRLQKAP